MAMNPRTHPRGTRPDFTLPKPNPNPNYLTDALWWLVCMREALEPTLSENGGTFANKAGSHNIGVNLPDYGEGDRRTDHSIRHGWNRTGPWWRSKCAAHDWTFIDAQHGDYRTINKYTRRQIAAMSDPKDLRPDEVIFYALGNTDSDVTTEGYNEIRNGPETSGDTTHTWHLHDSFFRNAVGDFWAMWKVLTIDMGWTYADWLRSIAPEGNTKVALTEPDKQWLSAQITGAVRTALYDTRPAWTEDAKGGYRRNLIDDLTGDPWSIVMRGKTRGGDPIPPTGAYGQILSALAAIRDELKALTAKK